MSTNGAHRVVSSAAVLALIVASASCGFHSLDYLDRGSPDAGADGTSVTVDGSAGDGATDGEATCPPSASDRLGAISAIAAAGRHVCALARDGHVYCWGENDAAQVGLDRATTTMPYPSLVQTPGVQTRVTTGGLHSCALDREGLVWCWGEGATGEVGGANADGDTHPIPVRLSTQKSVDGPFYVAKELSAGEGTTCAIGLDDRVTCAGHNDYGQLGVDPKTAGTDRALLPVASASPANRLLAGHGQVCAAGASAVRCWGNDDVGALGAPTSVVCGATACSWDSLAVRLPSPFAFPVRALGGFDSPCAIDATGKLACWGNASSGQTGDVSFGLIGVGPTEPHFVAGVTDAVAVAGGPASTCVVSATHRVLCWGSNEFGQLGPDAPRPADGGVTAPFTVQGVEEADGIAVGDDFACAVSRCGEVTCWGKNDRGQLGSGDLAPTTGLVHVVAPR